ncbi:MAG: DUF4860 domain-containing protein [Peptococcaceae bacterium]|nr:DUF4860 domain-containing protein [Peptococcaceae bacterium]
MGQGTNIRHGSRKLYGANPSYAALYRVPTLLLVSLFAISTLIAASYGMKAYQGIVKGAEQNFVGRTGLAYIATKIRQSEAVAVELLENHTLVLIEEIDNQRYATSISLREGMLRESFGAYGSRSAIFDTAITAAQGFSVAYITNDLIEIALEDDRGAWHKMMVYVPFMGV